MDPTTGLINDHAFHQPPTTTASYNLAAEIWPFPINDGGGLELRRVQFGQFVENASLNLEASGNDPMVLDHRGARSGGSRKRSDTIPEDESGKNDFDGKRIKTGESRYERLASRDEAEENSSKPEEQNAKPPEPPKQDYIHVRARRGQATDSHSLAERARREKISERMKILQDLVPGCNKVIGKALVLDEIINYIQSLQRQVEFLSMKLEAVSSRMSPGIEGIPSKDFCQQTFDTGGVGFGSSQGTRDTDRGSSPEWLHMQIGGGFERTT